MVMIESLPTAINTSVLRTTRRTFPRKIRLGSLIDFYNKSLTVPPTFISVYITMCMCILQDIVTGAHTEIVLEITV